MAFMLEERINQTYAAAGLVEQPYGPTEAVNSNVHLGVGGAVYRRGKLEITQHRIAQMEGKIDFVTYRDNAGGIFHGEDEEDDDDDDLGHAGTGVGGIQAKHGNLDAGSDVAMDSDDDGEYVRDHVGGSINTGTVKDDDVVMWTEEEQEDEYFAEDFAQLGIDDFDPARRMSMAIEQVGDNRISEVACFDGSAMKFDGVHNFKAKDEREDEGDMRVVNHYDGVQGVRHTQEPHPVSVSLSSGVYLVWTNGFNFRLGNTFDCSAQTIPDEDTEMSFEPEMEVPAGDRRGTVGFENAVEEQNGGASSSAVPIPHLAAVAPEGALAPVAVPSSLAVHVGTPGLTLGPSLSSSTVSPESFLKATPLPPVPESQAAVVIAGGGDGDGAKGDGEDEPQPPPTEIPSDKKAAAKLAIQKRIAEAEEAQARVRERAREREQREQKEQKELKELKERREQKEQREREGSLEKTVMQREMQKAIGEAEQAQARSQSRAAGQRGDGEKKTAMQLALDKRFKEAEKEEEEEERRHRAQRRARLWGGKGKGKEKF